MNVRHALGCCAALAGCTMLQAALLPLSHLDAKTVDLFNDYVGKFERDYVKPFTDSGKLWMDGEGCCARVAAAGKLVVEPRFSDDIPGGSIHHFSGSMHLDGVTIEDMRHLMEDYPNYRKNFKPDVTEASAELQPDSTRGDDHFVSHLTITESTLWMNVQFDTRYDTHYRYVDDHHWISKSMSLHLREQKDAKDISKGYYPEGDDHGFLWRTNTYWFARQSGDGLDLEADSITLSRANVPGFAWFGTKRSHDAVEKMLRDAKIGLTAAHRAER